MMEAKAQACVRLAVLGLPASGSQQTSVRVVACFCICFLPAVSLMLFEGHRSDNQFYWLMLFINFF